jgi:hypothetical protein
VPCHHPLDENLDAWIAAAGIGDDKKGPLFRSFKKGDKLTGNPMIRSDVLYMIKRRAKGAALPTPPVVILFGQPGRASRTLASRILGRVEMWRGPDFRSSSESLLPQPSQTVCGRCTIGSRLALKRLGRFFGDHDEGVIARVVHGNHRNVGVVQQLRAFQP